jgi:hypothetical protein
VDTTFSTSVCNANRWRTHSLGPMMEKLKGGRGHN